MYIYLTVCKQMSSDLFKNIIKKIFTNYMYKQDYALNNLRWLICHKTKPNSGLLIVLVLDRVTSIGQIDLFLKLVLGILETMAVYKQDYWIGIWNYIIL